MNNFSNENIFKIIVFCILLIIAFHFFSYNEGFFKVVGAGSPCDGKFKECGKGLKCGTKNKQTVCVAK